MPEDLPGMHPDFAGEHLADRMGIKIIDWSPNRLVGTMPVTGNRQPYGLLHGGANAVLAETLGSTAAALSVGLDRATMGLELSCTHHRAATEGDVTGVATPVHVGRSTATVHVVITDESGRRTCTARLTCIIRDKPAG
ncbi:MAG: hotdog fold thioesterase [Pseudonocardiaceae bacterium]|nr:hotdog fold thioesterase [Pseudonocardiaceae bacterium]